MRAARDPGAAPTHALLRLSAQRYNEPADYERLADALAAAASPERRRRAASGIVAG